MKWDFRTKSEKDYDRRLWGRCSEMTDYQTWINDKGPPAEPTDEFYCHFKGPMKFICTNTACTDSKISPVLEHAWEFEGWNLIQLFGVCQNCECKSFLMKFKQLIIFDNL